MITKSAALTRENFSLPVNLAVWAMSVFPRFLRSEDAAHAAFFESAHLAKMTHEQIHGAMYEAAPTDALPKKQLHS